MAQARQTNSSSPFLAFVVGALVVAVGVLGYAYFAGEADSPKELNVTIERPKLSR